MMTVTFNRMYKLLSHDRLIVAAYEKDRIFRFARKHKIKGTLVEEFVPDWERRILKSRNKILTGSALINVN